MPRFSPGAQDGQAQDYAQGDQLTAGLVRVVRIVRLRVVMIRAVRLRVG